MIFVTGIRQMFVVVSTGLRNVMFVFTKQSMFMCVYVCVCVKDCNTVQDHIVDMSDTFHVP